MKYLSLSRDSFDSWCDAVGICSYKYEFSNRTYFISGEFYALADKEEIKRIKQLHGDRWSEYYSQSKYEDVIPFLVEEKIVARPTERYEPQSKEVLDFIEELNK